MQQMVLLEYILLHLSSMPELLQQTIRVLCQPRGRLEGNGIEKVVGNRSGVSWRMKLPFVRGIVRHAILHYYLRTATPLYQV